MNNFVAPTGYVDLDNDCEYSIDRKSTRSREEVNPKEDLAFYFKTYIVPKYGLNNINVSNVASFMKDLEMNWTKLDAGMKDQVLNIMVDDIFQSGNYDFKNSLLAKLGVPDASKVPVPPLPSKPTGFSKSTFGKEDDNTMMYLILIVILFALVLFAWDHYGGNSKPRPHPKLS